MSDLSGLSNDELMRLYGEAQAAPSPDISRLSDAELRSLYERHAPQQPAGALPPLEDAGTAATIARGLLNGIPIAGPYIVSGANKAAAGIRALANDTRYSDELKRVEAASNQMAASRPITTGLSEFGGAVLGTAPAVAMAPAAFGASAAPLALRIGASAVTNSAIGGADAAARSGGDIDAIRDGAKFGALGGAASPLIAAGAGKLAAGAMNRFRPGEVPSSDELRSLAHAAYQQSENAGVRISQPAFQAAVDDIGTVARNAGLDPTIHPKATAALGRLEGAIGTTPSLKDADTLRRVIGGAAKSIEPDERRISSMMIDALDERINALRPADVVAGDPEAATAALREGRNLWGRARRSEMVQDAVEYARDRAASSGSGGNVDNATRQNIRGILDNPKRARGFSEAEQDAMRQVVRGTPTQNLLRAIGKLSPTTGALPAVMGLGASMQSSLDQPWLVAPSIAGLLAKTVADRATARNVGLLDALVRNGGVAPVSPLALPARRGAELLATDLLAASPLVANQRR